MYSYLPVSVTETAGLPEMHPGTVELKAKAKQWAVEAVREHTLGPKVVLRGGERGTAFVAVE